MRVGVDGATTLGALKLDPLGMLDKAVEYGYEGLMCSGMALVECDRAYRQQLAAEAAEHGFYIELHGAGVNPRASGKSVDEMVDPWRPLFPVAVEVGSRILNTCFGLIKERTSTSPTFQEQVQATVEVLRALGEMAEAHDVIVTMELHADLTSGEMIQILDQVDSPNVQASLDTANSFVVLEDPVDAARNLAPYVRATHLKDSCVYLTEEGMYWLGGAPLGRGLVDLPRIVDILYQANPEINLTIEDSGGRLVVPVYDAAYMESFADWSGRRLAKMLNHLWKGELQVRSGLHTTAEEAKHVDWAQVVPDRQQVNAAYAKALRDSVVARYAG
jgi:sugar phosphate isomerase/epimerase